MIDQSLHQVFLEAMGRIQRLEATSVDLALVLVMSEFIDEVGGSVEMAKQIDSLEAKWQKGLREYARGGSLTRRKPPGTNDPFACGLQPAGRQLPARPQ